MNFTYKQPYVTWKGPSTGSAVPTWSRPLINNNTNTNTGTSFAARPIKHWRKQLVPAANTGISGRSHVGMPMDRPGGSVYLHSAGYLGATVDCSNCPVNLTDLIPTTKNTIFDTTKDASGNCVACNPETNIIKSGITLLNKNYYSDTKAYLQSQCQTYDQKLSITPIPGNSYINSITHQPIPPSDSPTGSQVYYTENCSKKCATVNSVVRTIYKPNNQQYSQQGSVSSSSRLTRLKNNTMTKNGNSFKTAWGQQGANAGRYQGSSDSSYFIKTKNQECVPHHRSGNKTTSCNSIVSYENEILKKYKYFAYVANSNDDSVYGYLINEDTGKLTLIQEITSDLPSPKVLTVVPNGTFLYVATNGDHSISGYKINQTTGSLTFISTILITEQNPNAMTVDPTGSFLYVTTNSNAFIHGYKINSDGTLTFINKLITGAGPDGVTVSRNGKFVYVATGLTGSNNDIYGYTINPTTGELTIITGSPFLSAVNGEKLSITVVPNRDFVYVTNDDVTITNGQVCGYTINSGSGVLTEMTTSFDAESTPSSIAVDPNGNFIYVTNEESDTVSAYTIKSSGDLDKIDDYDTGVTPTSVTVDPTGKFLYVTNSENDNISGYIIDSNTGGLTVITTSPFNAGDGPLSIITVRTSY
jgi:6-phosphogluconolactonase (cycloisomerase 2 family)